MSVRSWCYRASWLAQGCLPLLRPFALLLASRDVVPSGSLLRVPRQVFAMGSPFRVEPISILDRNVDSSFTFLVLVGVFAMGSPCLRSRSERRLFAHLPLQSRCVRSRSSDRYRSRLGRPRSWGDRSRSLDRYRSRWNRSRHDRLRSLDRSRLRRLRAHSPARREVGVTARGPVVGAPPSLPACGLSGQDERSRI